ncbi:MAG: AraC family transcriptional regulator [Bacteroidetes bacterium HGW-Bacteroidetes-9]|jgi:AraC-like DNA-binding protein|nr:MAG: AraC family transcriptional regulator [Bacteroidetes bacterium HGW-Bacteroidetes-9]
MSDNKKSGYLFCQVKLKNMVSSSCLKYIRHLLESSGAQVSAMKLGEVRFGYDPLVHNESFYLDLLASEGYDQTLSREEQIIEKTKIAVIELIHQAGNVNSLIRNSDYLVERLGMSYTYLSTLFSKYEHITLEKFIILHKIEKVKELLEYNEFTLSEIALQLGYSSVQYLSNQFKQVTGISVTDYKKSGGLRIPLEQIGKPDQHP